MRLTLAMLALVAWGCNHNDQPNQHASSHSTSATQVTADPSAPAAPSVPTAAPPARTATPSIVAIGEVPAGSAAGSGAVPYDASFPAAPIEHVETKTTAIGPLDVHLARADVPAKVESVQLVWFDLDPDLAGSPAQALKVSCDAFDRYPLDDVAATPVWLPALEGLHAFGERPVAGVTSKSLVVRGLKACDLHLVAESTHVRARVIGSGFRIYQLVVTSVGGEPPAADVDAFFGAFRAHPLPPAPARVAEPIRRHDAFTAIAAGVTHTCALDGHGEAWCWGNDIGGQLGGPVEASSTVPRPLAAGARIRTIAAGGSQTCAILDDQKLRCWGRVIESLPEHRPWDVVGLPSAVRSIGLGGFFDCVALADGTIWCWGSNALGELGTATQQDSAVPVQIAVPGGAATEVSAGSFHVCARMQDGAAWCWGSNREGQIGGTALGVLAPTRIALGRAAAQVGAGGTFSCARLDDGTVWCWGRVGVTSAQSPPTQMALPAPAVEIAVGNQFACARLGDGSIWCWGSNMENQLGYSDRCDSYPPPSVCEVGPPRQVPLGEPATALTVGDTHVCALTASGQARCWGDGGSGQLGDGTKTSRPRPKPTK